MLQIALVLNKNSHFNIDSLNTKIFMHSLIPAQPGISDIANEMGIQRPKSTIEQEIILIDISTSECNATDFRSLVDLLRIQIDKIDFLILQQSGLAFEVLDFLNLYEETQEEWQSLFVNLIEADGAIVSLGLEAWGLPDLSISQSADNHLDKLLEIILYHIKSPIKSQEKVSFDSEIYKVIVESKKLQPQGIENPKGIFRLIKQV